MSPFIRKFNLTTHVTVSVGWIGAVASFLVLSIAGIASQDAIIVRSSYISMDLIGRFMIIPLSVLSMLTGLVLAFWTQWGLVRYYWVFVKFVLGIFSSIGLVLHQYVAIGEVAKKVAATATFSDPGRLGPQLIMDASLAILVLLIATVLSIYKPWGLTPYGLWEQRVQRNLEPPATRIKIRAELIRFGLKISFALAAILIIIVAIVHLSSKGFGTH